MMCDIIYAGNKATYWLTRDPSWDNYWFDCVLLYFKYAVIISIHV